MNKTLFPLVLFFSLLGTRVQGQLTFDPANPPTQASAPTEVYHHYVNNTYPSHDARNDSHQKGPKTVMVMVVRPTDGGTYTNPPTVASLQSGLNSSSQRYYEASYHQTWFGPKFLNGNLIPQLVVTEVLDLPEDSDYYKGSFGLLQMHCLQAVRNQGGDWNGGKLDPNNFDRWVVMSNVKMIGSAGLAYVGGRFSWVGDRLSGGVALHEWGHNWGVYHANLWTVPEGDEPRAETGTHHEYKDGWCVMGGNSLVSMFNPQFRVDLKFLEDGRNEVMTVTGSGTYRIHNYIQHDRRQPETLLRALVLPVSMHHGYWTEDRSVYLGFGHVDGVDGGWRRQDYNRNAVTVHSNLSTGTNLIDTTPYSRPGDADRDDSGIKIGRTYSEGPGVNGVHPNGGFHVTPVLRGSTEVNGQTHEWIEVVIHLQDSIESNSPPAAAFPHEPSTMLYGVTPGVPFEISVNASDPDGDPLAYDWDFGDETYNLVNSGTQTKTWDTAGVYLVQVTVSDMKGGTAVAQTWVNVGGQAFREPENPPATLPGLAYEYYEGRFAALPDTGTLFPVKTGTVSTVNLSPRERDSEYAFVFHGYLEVPADDVYTFHLNSKDGARFHIGDLLLIDNDGIHRNPSEHFGSLALNAGKHAIRVEMFNRDGSGTLSLDWSTLSMDRAPVPATNLYQRDWSGIDAPSVSLATPSPGSTHTMGEDILLTAVADSPAGIDRVAYFSNGVYLGEAFSAPWSFPWPDAYGGERELHAIAHDGNGRSALSDPVVIQVDFPEGGADTISINLARENPLYDFPAAESAGVMPRTNWNHLTGHNHENLIDNDGNVTNVGFSTTALYYYHRATASGSSADHRMMSAYRGNTGSTSAYTFTNIPYATYDVYVYWGAHYRDEAFPDFMRVTLEDEIYWIRVESSTWDGEWIESTATTKAEAATPASYIVFREVSQADFTLNVFTDTANGENRAGPAGVQIVRSDALPPPPPPPPPPAAPSNLTVTHVTHYEVVLMWTDNADDELEYRVYRATDSEGPWTLLEVLPADSGEYTDNTVTSATPYVYRVNAWNEDGESEASNTVSVTTAAAPGPPVIIAHPESQTVTEGHAVSFSVEAAGNPAPSYQWRKNGVELPGANAPAFNISAVSFADMGDYEVVVWNDIGQITSSAASLTVTEDTSHTQQFLVNFVDGTYTTDGTRVWQSLQLRQTTGPSPKQEHSNVLLQNTEGDDTAGVRISVSSTVTSDIGTNTPAADQFSENPFAWFTPTEAAQVTVYSFSELNASWTYTLEGFDPGDEVTFEMVIRRNNNGRNITLVYNPGETDTEILLNNADSGITRYVTHTTSGATSYSFVLSSDVSGWVATLNAMAVTVVKDASPPPVVPATVTLSNLTRIVDGSPKTPEITTEPANLAVTLTFDGSATVPSASGIYEVVATVTEPGYEGSATATFTLLTEEGFVDSNHNGVDDAWEALYFEPDEILEPEYTVRGVTLPLRGWFIAGLNPKGQQLLEFHSGMQFDTVSGRRYEIQHTSDLTGTEGPGWQTVEILDGNDAPRTLTNPQPGFYRIRVRLAPYLP